MLPTGDSHQPLPAPAALKLGDLPPDVLNKVLADLPASDVVRTSVLSQTWRSRWKTVPDLEIDLDDRVRDWESAAGFLERCAAPVRGVSIRGIPLRLFDRADGWVRTVAGKSPRSLSVAMPMTALPSLFACDPAALADLKLVTCVLPPPPPAFTGFRGLTSLDLDYVVFSGEKGWERLEAMISAAAPTLEKLRLANIAFDHVAAGEGFPVPGAWIIQAPNLRWLELRLTMAGAGSWELGHLPKLNYANITLNAHEPRDYGGMLTALSSVRELEIGNFDCATFQVDGITVMLVLSCIFENLRILKLHTHFYEASTMLSTISLLRQAPFIQVLEITDNSRHEINKEVNAFAENFLSTLPNCSLVKNLERLHMKSISCSPNDMHFIKHVLLYARNLQMASVENFKGHWNSALDASRMLKEFESVSPAARICFQHRDSCWDVISVNDLPLFNMVREVWGNNCWMAVNPIQMKSFCVKKTGLGEDICTESIMSNWWQSISYSLYCQPILHWLSPMPSGGQSWCSTLINKLISMSIYTQEEEQWDHIAASLHELVNRFSVTISEVEM